jgi:hypothetical protein
LAKEKDTAVIPKGVYCYSHTGKMVKVYHSEANQVIEVPGIICCPYWASWPNKPEQENGYCHYLEEGDWEVDGISHLWDQIKECGINDEWDEEE